jgi:hypothetical protein
MKKFIGVAIVMLTLALAVIYRQLTHRLSVRPDRKQVCVPVTLRDGALLSCLFFQ